VNDAANVAADNLRACGRWTETERNDESNCNDKSNRGEWSKKNSIKLFLKVHLRLLKSWSRPAGAGLWL
jgi:hypothetical protein